MVQWDAGTRSLYRCGEDDKFDLRVFDAAPTGLQFPSVICSGCYVDGVAGIHWQCAHCYGYHLCHSCYLLGRHCQEHPFFRVESKEQAARVKVSCRAGAKRVEAKGVFVGAEVVRGPHWRFGDQDGGTGKTGKVVGIERWKTVTSRSVAKVEWSAGGPANIYRMGHKGKVDLCCISVGSGGYYCPEHLATLGFDAAVTIFDEEEIVAGDFVKVELDPDVFKMMHEAAGLWTNETSLLYDQAALVLTVLEQQRLCISRKGDSSVVFCNAVTKLLHCRVGQTVRVISDLSRLRQLQGDEIWTEELFITAGKIGRVTEVYIIGRVQVYVQGRGWLFSPLCLEPAPGETAPPHTPDPHHENIAMVSNLTCTELKEQARTFGYPNKLLDGDLTALGDFLYSNQTKDKMKQILFEYYVNTRQMNALRRFLNSGIDPEIIEFVKEIDGSIMCNNAEAVAALLEAGADVNGTVDENGLTLLMRAVTFGNPHIVRKLATYPGVRLDAQLPDGTTAIRISENLSDHKSTAILLAAGANPTVCLTNCSPLHSAALHGNVAVTEVFIIHAKEHFCNMDKVHLAPLHLAAGQGHTQLCSLLAAETSININIESLLEKSSPIHVAVLKSDWNAIECLVGWGAALNLVDSNGDTPLHDVVRSKSPVIPNSPQIKQVREELSEASGGRAVEGYVAVACFLVREGADWHAKTKGGVSSRQALPPTMASLVAEYLRKHPGPGTFHGSLRREQQQRKLQELPIRLKLACPPPSSVSASAASATATDSLSSKNKDYGNFGPGTTKPVVKSGLLPKAIEFDKGIDVKPSGVLRQPCLLCEDHPANIRFSPCGHTVLCSDCARRATKCLQCRVYVESKNVVK